MKPIDFKFEKGTLNSTFLRVKNCMVTLPPYEKFGYSSRNFFLDKRLGLEQYKTLPGEVVDDFELNGIRYYLVHNYTTMEGSVWCFDNDGLPVNIILPGGEHGFLITENSPKRFAIGKGLIGTPNSTPRSVDLPEAGTSTGSDFDWTLIPSYAGGYIKFKYTGVQNLEVGDYIVWRSGALLGGVNRIEFIDGDYVFIIGTNSRGTIPRQGTLFDVYKFKDDLDNIITFESNTLLVGYENGVNLIITDGYNKANTFNVLNPGKEVIDLVNFDGNIFALTNDSIYFSRTTYEDNTQFYPLDRFGVINGKKLFSLGKALLLFAGINKLYVRANTNNSSEEYVGYDVNYDGELFSKYSQIFADQTIYVLQKDKQLKQIDIIQYNNTAYDLKVSDVLLETPGLFNTLDGGDIYINSNQRYLNFLYVNNGKTINYQYDKMYKHFIEQHYNKVIYKYGDKILGSEQIFIQNGYLDDGIEYSQEINFLINTESLMNKPYIIRTIFGLVPNLFNVNLNIEFELGGKLDTIDKTLSSFDFDNRLSTTLTGDELLEDTNNNESSQYNGTVVSIQSNLMKWGRFIRFKYFSSQRFMIGNSYLIVDESKPYRNEPLLTN